MYVSYFNVCYTIELVRESVTEFLTRENVINMFSNPFSIPHAETHGGFKFYDVLPWSICAQAYMILFQPGETE